MEFPKELEDNIRDIIIEITDDGVDLEIISLKGGGFFVKDVVYPSITVHLSSSIPIRMEQITDSLTRLDLFCSDNDCMVSVLSVYDKDGNYIYTSSLGSRSNKILNFIEFTKTDQKEIQYQQNLNGVFHRVFLKQDIYEINIGISYIND